MSLQTLISLGDLEKQKDLPPAPPSPRLSNKPQSLKLDTSVMIAPLESAYTPYSSFLPPPLSASDDLPTPISTKARQAVSIFQTLLLFHTAYPFRLGLVSQLALYSDISCCRLQAAASGFDWVIWNLLLISTGYFHFCLASLEDKIEFKVGRGWVGKREVELVLGGKEANRKRGWKVTWWPGYFWGLVIDEVLILGGAVISDNEWIRIGAVAVVVMFGWVLGWRALRPLGVGW